MQRTAKRLHENRRRCGLVHAIITIPRPVGTVLLKNLSQKGRLSPDLILLDLNLPGVDGVDVLGKILAIPRLSEVPVVILTSSESPSDMQRTARIGAARYIRKPSALEDFYREVGSGVEEMLLRGESG
jgi:CheY-like chemotaxis protein